VKKSDDDFEAVAWLKCAESRNDPDYLSGLEEKMRVVDDIASSVNSVVLFRDGKRNRVEVGLARPSRTAEATNVAAQLGLLLEAPVRVVETPQAGNAPDVPQKYINKPPHKFFRSDVTFSKRR